MKNPELTLLEKEGADVPVFLNLLRERVLEVERSRIQETDFSDLYQPNIIQRDLKLVESVSQKINQQGLDVTLRQNQVWGETLEAFLHTQINQQHLFGEHVTGIKTSRFDDIAAGVDEIIVILRTDGVAHFGLGVDYTFANPTKKIQKNIEMAKQGKLAVLKYFQVDVPGWRMRGELKTPRIVLGVSRDSIRRDLAYWVENKQEEINKSGLQMLLLMQITDQLEAYEHVTSSDESKKHYRLVLQQVEDLKSKKRREGIQMGGLKNDPVHQLLCNSLQEVYRSRS